MSRTPSLTSMRAFEAVARLGSLSRAAEALFVTPAAISHRIKELEAEVGTALFVRDNGVFRPTPAAIAGLRELSDAFGRISNAFETIRDHAQDDHRLHIVGSSSIMSIVVGRLWPDFRARLPDVTFGLEPTVDPLSNDVYAPDVIICDRPDRPDDRDWQLLVDDRLMVSAGIGMSVDDPLGAIMGEPGLIEVEWNEVPGSYLYSWRSFFDRLGLAFKTGSVCLRVTHADMALALAERGAGLALTGRVLAGPLVAERRLQPVLVTDMPGPTYWIHNAAKGLKRPNADQVIAMIKARCASLAGPWPPEGPAAPGLATRS